MPREILIRADGRVTYLTVSSNFQKSVAGAFFALLAWASFSSIGMMLNERTIAEKNSEVAAARAAYGDLMAGVGSAYDQFAKLVGSLEQSQTELLGLADSEVGAGQDPQRLAEVTRRATEARESLGQADAAIRAKLAVFEADLKAIAAQHQKLTDTIAGLEGELRTAGRERHEMQADNAALNAALGRADQEISLAQQQQTDRDERIRFLQQQVAALTQDRSALIDARNELAAEINKLGQRLVAYQRSQQSVVQNLAERTRSNVDEVVKTVAMTGLDVDTLLSRAGETMPGAGGPFVDLRKVPDLNAAETALLTVARLDNEVDRWDRLQFVLRSLPLAAPLDRFLLASGFGKRRDPFNGRLALHEGLDLLSELGVPVMATAPGKVVFAGWKGDYGRMVEIDHGLGIHTRYAHLKSIDVRVGDEVAYRQKIGALGSSGRSSGPHVHYEVRVDDKPYDPMNFLEAGRYVFKG
ncbi:MAG: peptidoglycan DD-metalloendopeptidase family protein [Pseudomonadota bacterium]